MRNYRCLNNAFAGDGLGGLFQRADFFNLHADRQGNYFEWTDGERIAATVHFTNAGNGLWRSPARGTFAGFSFRSDLSIDDLFAFLDEVEANLKSYGAQHIEVLPAPMAHDPTAFSNQFYLLSTRGYKMTHCDLNHHVAVDSHSLSERMTYGNQKRLRKCRREGLITEQMPLSSLADVYHTLSENRARKNRTMSMTFAQIQTMADVFPNDVILFGCRDGELLAASAICFRLNSTVLYVFYWGDLPGYESRSPVVAVADAIYSYCQTSDISLLDVGTSTMGDTPNLGLIQFKRGLGFTESIKVRMHKSL